MENKYKLVAPDVDRLLRFFDKGHLNPSGVRPKLDKAMKPLFKALAPIAPLKSNDEAKAIWVQIPRGDISDYDSFEDLKEYGEVKTYKEYEKLWREDYPDEVKWYRLVIVEGKNREGKVDFKAVAFGDKTIISAMMDEKGAETFSDDAAVALCKLLVPAAKKSVELLKRGKYNKMVSDSLPYQFRTGVMKRSDLWKHEPNFKNSDFDGLSKKTINTFRNLLAAGMNDKTKIGRIKDFTANEFFKACAIGYKACKYKVNGMSPVELYLKYADGRDEGLTGTGHGLNAGPGIDFDNAEEWHSWYFGARGGGHPWEVVRGGNSTHVSLYVMHDKNAGWYFEVAGKHRPFESVSFYTALSAAGLPVFLCDAQEILARFEGSDYVGIVPHSVIPKYCEGMFPDIYGRVIDFMHIYDEELKKYGKDIIWLPEEEAKLLQEYKL